MRSACSVVLVLAWSLILVWGRCHAEGTAAAEPSGASQSQVLYLHTEFLPYRRTADPYPGSRLGRELVRQAILMAARDELGLATRDETLQETVPAEANVTYLMPLERADATGKWRVQLVSLEDVDRCWEKTYDYDYVADAANSYGDIIPKIENDTRGALLDGLRTFGLQGAKPPVREPLPPGPEVELLLGTVDCVAQFAAVRTAHEAIAAHGETPEWLSVLVRGYANLALLTRHYWNSSPEVFTARCWLYAQRLVVVTSASDMAQWHRAYAWAWGGAWHHALADVAELELRRQQGSSSAAGSDAPLAPPAWTKLIKAYCLCDRSALQQVGREEPATAPWAAVLRFQLASFSGQPQWMLTDAREIKDLCPTAYGVHGDLLNHFRRADLKGLGVAWASPMFSRYVPKSLAALAGLPDGVQQLLADSQARSGPPPDGSLEGDSDKPFSPLPMELARLLRTSSEENDRGEPSWSTLAYLLEEEQFVQVVYQVLEVRSAVEGVELEEVDRLLPLVENHRYAAFVEGFRHDIRQTPETAINTWRALKLVDPRMNMYVMMYMLWNTPGPDGQGIGGVAYVLTLRTSTIQGLLEYVGPLTNAIQPPAEKAARTLISELRTIGPHAPGADYLEILWAGDPSAEQLQVWEDRLKEEPKAWTALAQRYVALGDFEGAARCYSRLLAVAPQATVAIALAELHLQGGRVDQWEQTLLDFLGTDSASLQLSEVRAALAQGYIDRGQWAKARLHAEALAQSGAVRDLLLASKICEGLADWPQSEQWIRRASEVFPSTASQHWFFWCQRTGRGDNKAARAYAQSHVEAARNPKLENLLDEGLYRVLNGDFRAALSAYRRALNIEPTITSALMAAQLARAVREEKLRSEVLNTLHRTCMERAADEKPEDQAATAAGLAILELMQTGDASQERLDQIDASLRVTELKTRSALAYYLGKELDALGKSAEAEVYWRRTLVTPQADIRTSTLAGFELAKRHGTSRPEGDRLTEDDLWPVPTAAGSH